MKVILINPDERSVSEIEIGSSLKEIYAALKCSTFECPVTFKNGDILYCDEEAWLFFEEKWKLESQPSCGGFMLRGWLYPILGRGLVIGNTSDGRSVDCKSTIADFDKIFWKSAEEMKRQGEIMGLISEI